MAKPIVSRKPREQKHRGAPPAGPARAAICEELECLGELVQVLGAADHANCEMPLDKSLYWVGESLRRVGQRVLLLEVKR